MRKQKINFPEIPLQSTLEVLPVVVITMLLSPIVLPFSKTVGIILVVPAVLWSFASTLFFLKRFTLRRKWAQGFEHTLSWRTAIQKVQEGSSNHYVLYVKHFGGFDCLKIRPMAVLSNTHNDMKYAIPTSHWSLQKKCTELGITVHSV